MGTATAKTLEEMQALQRRRKELEAQAKVKRYDGLRDLWSEQERAELALRDALGPFLDSLAGERQRLVEVACEMQRQSCGLRTSYAGKKCWDHQWDSRHARNHIEKTPCPPLESILARLAEEEAREVK